MNYEFKKYIHLERFGTDEVDGIELGKCYVFPKIDGTNAVVWSDGWHVWAGSRNRQIALDADNQGFAAHVAHNEALLGFARDNPGRYIYGEWLVPHTIKGYRDDAWRQFYIFDILDGDEFLPYEELANIVPSDLNLVTPLAIVTNPTYEDLHRYASENRFLMADTGSIGEGVVIKRYDFKNRFGRTTWAKLVLQHFKEQPVRAMGAPERENKMIEEAIAAEYITPVSIDKIIAKIRNDEGSFQSKHIPRLLSQSFHELVTEELWQILKQYKNPKIDFKTLNHFVIARVKQLQPALFGV